MKQIAQTFGVAVSTPTRTIDRLVEKGFVNRTVGTKDRRQLLIKLTPKGKNVLAKMDKENLEMTKKLLKSLSDEELKFINIYYSKYEIIWNEVKELSKKAKLSFVLV